MHLLPVRMVKFVQNIIHKIHLQHLWLRLVLLLQGKSRMAALRTCPHLDQPLGSLLPPPTAHVERQHVKRAGNAWGSTWHCGHCNPCPVCKGKFMEVKTSVDEKGGQQAKVIYYHLKTCSLTPVIRLPKALIDKYGLVDGHEDDSTRKSYDMSQLLKEKSKGAKVRVPTPDYPWHRRLVKECGPNEQPSASIALLRQRCQHRKPWRRQFRLRRVPHWLSSLPRVRDRLLSFQWHRLCSLRLQ